MVAAQKETVTIIEQTFGVFILSVVRLTRLFVNISSSVESLAHASSPREVSKVVQKGHVKSTVDQQLRKGVRQNDRRPIEVSKRDPSNGQVTYGNSICNFT